MAENNSFAGYLDGKGKHCVWRLLLLPASTAGAGVKSTTFTNIKYTRRLGELCEWIVKTDVKIRLQILFPFRQGFLQKALFKPKQIVYNRIALAVTDAHGTRQNG